MQQRKEERCDVFIRDPSLKHVIEEPIPGGLSVSVAFRPLDVVHEKDFEEQHAHIHNDRVHSDPHEGHHRGAQIRGGL